MSMRQLCVTARGRQTKLPAVPPRLRLPFGSDPEGPCWSGPEHQAKVKEVADDIEARGLEARFEYEVETPGGEKDSRFVDVVARDRTTKKVVEMHQIGRQTAISRRPVAREQRALDDIFK